MDPTMVDGVLDDLRRRGSDHADVEVKRAQEGLPRDMWESLSALANAGGGLILLGIDEKSGFRIVGVNDPAATERNLAVLCTEMEPPVRATISTLPVENRNIVHATVPPVARDRRPCYRRALGPYLGSRIRVADGNRKLTEYEVSVLLANQREPRDDQTPVPEASLEDFDGGMLQAYLARLRETRPSVFAGRPDESLLIKTNVLVDTEKHPVPTLAGLLAFGEYPQQFFPQLNVSLVRYPTPAAGATGPHGERFLDSISIDGPVSSIVRDAISALKRNMQRRSVIMGLFRQEEWEYPEVALREALVNALVHRDLSVGARGTQVQIEMYPDRLVIRNPGGLYGPVSVDDLGLTGTSSSRNRTLLKILADTPVDRGHSVCENVGSGIFTMRRALADAGMESPEFRDNIATFEVVLPNHTLLDQETLDWMTSLGAEGLNGPQMIAIALARRGHSLTNRSFRTATGVADSRDAGRQMRELVDWGILVMEGSRGSATYRLSEAAQRRGKRDESRIDPASSVLSALRRGPRTRREVETATGLPKSTVFYYLRRMRESGQVEMIGSERSKATVWRLSREA